jgi:hypothetical protein
MQGVLQEVLKVQHNAGGTTSKKKGGGATLYPMLHLSQYHVTGGHTGNQTSKQASKTFWERPYKVLRAIILLSTPAPHPTHTTEKNCPIVVPVLTLTHD